MAKPKKSTRPLKKKSQKQQKPPLFPAAVTAFCWRRLYEGMGLGFIALGVLTLVALMTYYSGDPSGNTGTAADAAVRNWIGLPGAYVADGLLQYLGPVASILLTVVLGLWGLQMFRNKMWFSRWREFIWLLAGLTLIATALGVLPGSFAAASHTGGSIGGMLFRQISGLGPVFDNIMAKIAVALLCAALGLYALLRSFGYSREEWHHFIGMNFDRMADWQETRSERRAALPTPDTRLIASRAEPKAAPRPAKRDIAVAPRLEKPAPPAKVLDIKTGKRFDTEKPRSEAKIVPRETGDFILPPLDLLQQPEAPKAAMSEAAMQKNAELLHGVLEDFSVRGEIIRVSPGPVVTLYEMEPAPGLKSSRVIGLADDIARSMHAVSVRAAVIPGRNAIGIELPNKDRETVYLRELLASEEFANHKGKLPLILGKDISGQPIIADLAKMPHLLIAGTTGSGKSVGVNAMILSLLYRMTPAECRLIMIDPKMLELSVYEDIPHLLTPVVTEPKKAIVALKWAVREMEDRYRNMSKMGVRNIDGYNDRLRNARENNEILSKRVQTGFDPDTGKPIFEDQIMDLKELPYIVVIVDEFADLMLVAGKDVEGAIQRLAQMARAAGIHLIMATQRPSVDVITGTIKANFPSRISYQVTSKIDSRTILGEGGAEALLGRGDLLYMAGGGRIGRVHGPFAADDEVEKIVTHLKTQGEPNYVDDVTVEAEEGGLFGEGESGGGDDLYSQAVQLVMDEGKASTSFIQRHLKIGYNRAATIIEQMEKNEVISPANHAGKREVLVGASRR